MRAEEPGSAGHQDFFHSVRSMIIGRSLPSVVNSPQPLFEIAMRSFGGDGDGSLGAVSAGGAPDSSPLFMFRLWLAWLAADRRRPRAARISLGDDDDRRVWR